AVAGKVRPDCAAVERGECPEWQRELTVNQPPYGFAGSSPASPTILRSLRELRLGKPAQMIVARRYRRLPRRSPQAGLSRQTLPHHLPHHRHHLAPIKLDAPH